MFAIEFITLVLTCLIIIALKLVVLAGNFFATCTLSVKALYKELLTNNNL